MEDARDIALALELHNRLNNRIGLTENAIITENIEEEDYEPRTLIDNTLELIDPTPNIHTLFAQFNARYFWNKLLSVEVKWSNRMTSCAGVCSFHPRNCQCVITLSAPLLKLRPRKDLVETLLHEMIHGYLFLTHNNRDPDGHGPEFHKHMYRINREAGTQITVYHNFHDEVKLYQQHWWSCNGPCQRTVRRAMNRAPGPNDNWWTMHQQTCGGQFTKVREPMKQPVKNKKIPKENENKVPTIPKSKDLLYWLTKPDKPKVSTPVEKKVPTKTTTADPAASKSKNNSIPTANNPSTFTKLGNTSNNIHGWGARGPTGSSGSSGSANVPSTSQGGLKSPKFYAVGVLGGSRLGKSNLLDKFPASKNSGPSKSSKVSGSFNGGNSSAKNAIVDLTHTPNKRKSDDFYVTNTKLPKIEIKHLPERANCPVCNETINISVLNDHLDECLISKSKSDNNQSIAKLPASPNGRYNDFPQVSSVCSLVVIGDSNDSEGFQSPTIIAERQKCLVCNAFIDSGTTLNNHLELCIGAIFMDDSIPEFEEDDENSVGGQPSPKKFPCPTCMTFIHEPFMNEHLATCLKENLTAK